MLEPLQKWFQKKRNRRRTYTVHLIAYRDTAQLNATIGALRSSYRLTILKETDRNAVSIEIRIRPSQLRTVLRDLPETVGVAYELKEPEKR